VGWHRPLDNTSVLGSDSHSLLRESFVAAGLSRHFHMLPNQLDQNQLDRHQWYLGQHLFTVSVNSHSTFSDVAVRH
jgi:hypothetical protein